MYKNYSVGEGVQWQAGIVPLGCEPSFGRITFLVGTSPGNEGVSADIDAVLNVQSASGASDVGDGNGVPAGKNQATPSDATTVRIDLPDNAEYRLAGKPVGPEQLTKDLLSLAQQPGQPLMGYPPIPSFAGGASLAIRGVQLGKQLASQAQMANTGIRIIKAGKLSSGTRLAKLYGGKASEWVKKSSDSFRAKDGLRFETHWYENIKTGLRVEFKTKMWR